MLGELILSRRLFARRPLPRLPGVREDEEEDKDENTKSFLAFRTADLLAASKVGLEDSAHPATVHGLRAVTTSPATGLSRSLRSTSRPISTRSKPARSSVRRTYPAACE